MHRHSHMNQGAGTPARSRRAWLKRALLAGASLPLLLREALAAGGQREGLVQIDGEVRVNGFIARTGAAVKPGDRLVTAPGAHAVFVVGQDAFLLRGGSELLSAGNNTAIATLRLVTGKLLSVFGRGPRIITTPTATIGIRGTGIYIEAQAERSYVCTCYGEVDLQAVNMPGAKETVRTVHHDAPRYIYAQGDMPIKMIEPAPVINHSDAELIMLEALVGRRPAFENYGGSYRGY
jgi:hypothetical protein